MSLLDMVKHATPEQLAVNQPQITSALCRLKELQDQRHPKVSFSPAIASSRRERLEGTLIYLASELSAIPAANWTTYKKKLVKFCDSGLILNMTFPQRLYKVMDAIYLPEELEAIPREDFERMRSVARICVTAAQAMGPEGEDTDALAEKWICAKAQDLEFLEKTFRSMRRIYKVSTPEQTEMQMPWEAQA
ncbi:glycoside hydrolase family 92 [Trichoderma cornu-damae]|uniref:Glycoside hydrolase family 92 n=1 Tax=Trichoderma cornu-damae TaxID=654480 RepID=A0A9P8QS95_9HYPO|nr:glycoside hydrolase family 92 [Trichoderma cornu-damae]